MANLYNPPMKHISLMTNLYHQAKCPITIYKKHSKIFHQRASQRNVYDVPATDHTHYYGSTPVVNLLLSSFLCKDNCRRTTFIAHVVDAITPLSNNHSCSSVQQRTKKSRYLPSDLVVLFLRNASYKEFTSQSAHC